MINTEIMEVEIDKIHPNRRLVFEEEIILRLCVDISLVGLLEPIDVEPVEYWFEIIDGEKRWRACKKIGMKRVRVRIIGL